MVDYNKYVADLYRNELGREPGDDQGFNAWVSALSSGGLTPQQVADQIERSSEGVNYDLSRVYQNELGRAPDESGIQSWGQALQSGALSDDQFQQMVRQSPEYGTAAVSQYQDLLNKIYEQEVGRTPDAGGAAQWAAALRSGAITPEQLPGLFSNTNEGWVYDQYADVFKRQPDPAARAWVDALEKGALTRDQVLAQLKASPEYSQLNPPPPGSVPGAPGYVPLPGAPAGSPGYVSAYQNYAPMKPLADPRSQTFGFLYDTINQRLGRDVTPKGLLDVNSINASFGASPKTTVAAPAAVNWAGGALQQTPASTGASTGSGASAGGGYTYQDVAPGPTNSTYNQWAAGNPNLVGGILDARNLVSNVYQQELNRAPDFGGLDSWSNAVYNGMTRQQLVDAIRASSEYQGLKSAPVAADTGYYTQSGPDGLGGNN